MPAPEQSSTQNLSVTAPTVTDVERIAATTEPVLRNLLITQTYSELSSAFAGRYGPEANWCTFATWASKQAGDTIRKEDLRRSLENMLQNQTGLQQSLDLVISLAKDLGATQTVDQLRRSVFAVVLNDAVNRSSEAVSTGNKKVFEEIAKEFARFIATCFTDTSYNAAHLEIFCKQLRPGEPPGGQDYLRTAFSCYYQSFFETDLNKRTEWRLLANLQIGFHEQTRLQPEIAAALNAGLPDVEQIKTRLLSILFNDAAFWNRTRLFFQQLFGRRDLLDRAIEALILKIQQPLHHALTLHLMTLTLPPANRLRLGSDLTMNFPENLKVLSNSALLLLLKKIDPTLDSLVATGATDWASLPERLHFICDLFRCYHESPDLFALPFTPAQTAAIKKGLVPEGDL